MTASKYPGRQSMEMSVEEQDRLVADYRANPTIEKANSHNYMRAFRLKGEREARIKNDAQTDSTEYAKQKKADTQRSIAEQELEKARIAKEAHEAAKIAKESAKAARMGVSLSLAEEAAEARQNAAPKTAARFIPEPIPVPENETEKQKKSRLQKELDFYELAVDLKSYDIDNESMEIVLRILRLPGLQGMDSRDIADELGVSIRKVIGLTIRWGIEIAPFARGRHKADQKSKSWNTPERKKMIEEAAKRGYDIKHQTHLETIKMLVFIHDIKNREKMRLSDIQAVVFPCFGVSQAVTKGVLRNYDVFYKHPPRSGMVSKAELAELCAKHGGKFKKMYGKTAEVMRKINALEGIEKMNVREVMAAVGYTGTVLGMYGIFRRGNIPYKNKNNDTY